MPQAEPVRRSPLAFGRPSRSLGSQVLTSFKLDATAARRLSSVGASPQSKPSPPPPSANLFWAVDKPRTGSDQDLNRSVSTITEGAARLALDQSSAAVHLDATGASSRTLLRSRLCIPTHTPQESSYSLQSTPSIIGHALSRSGHDLSRQAGRHTAIMPGTVPMRSLTATAVSSVATNFVTPGRAAGLLETPTRSARHAASIRKHQATGMLSSTAADFLQARIQSPKAQGSGIFKVAAAEDPAAGGTNTHQNNWSRLTASPHQRSFGVDIEHAQTAHDMPANSRSLQRSELHSVNPPNMAAESFAVLTSVKCELRQLDPSLPVTFPPSLSYQRCPERPSRTDIIQHLPKLEKLRNAAAEAFKQIPERLGTPPATAGCAAAKQLSVSQQRENRQQKHLLPTTFTHQYDRTPTLLSKSQAAALSNQAAHSPSAETTVGSSLARGGRDSKRSTPHNSALQQLQLLQRQGSQLLSSQSLRTEST